MKGSKPPLPVDHGWAWWVMVGYFVNVFITVSWVRALAILLPIFLETYHQPTVVTTLAFGISEIAEGIAHITLSLFLMDRFTVRSITLFGAVANVSAILSLCLSPNPVLLNTAFAVLGYARGVLNNPQVYILGVYFKKRHSFASAVANTGLSMATLFSPLLTQLLLNTYGLTGTFLVFGALATHSVIASLLFRPESMYDTNSVVDTQEDKLSLSPPTNNESDTIRRNFSACSNCSDCDELDEQNKRHVKHSYCDDDQSRESYEIRDNAHKNDIYVRKYRRPYENVTKTDKEGENSTFLRLEKDSNEDATGMMLQTQQGAPHPCVSCYRKKLTNPTNLFLILAGSFGIHTQFGSVYLPVLGLENDLSTSHLPMLVSLAGVSDIVGKMFFGLLADRKFMKPINVVFFTQFTVGTLFQFVSFYQGLIPMVAMSLLFGFNAGLIHTLLPPIIIELVGLPSLPLVVSSYFVGNCIITFLVHLVAGFIHDLTGSFIGGFHFVGALMLTSVVFLLITTWSTRRQRSELGETHNDCETRGDKNLHNPTL